MRRRSRRAWLGLLSVLVALWSGGAAHAASGRLRAVTYNVAGLPDGVSTQHPSRNMPLIGRLLNGYDLAFIQEDFAYASELRSEVRFPYATAPFVRGRRMDFGDGLSLFAVHPFSEHERSAWRACNGIVDSFFDCLTPKGFSFARLRLAPGVTVDVYNVHLDAGGSAADAAAREAQVEQLLEALRARSRGRALLLAGDTNIPASQRALLQRLAREAGLQDSCAALSCPEPRRIDRILFRSTPALRWTPRQWRLDRRFVDARQRPLSDHLAVSVELDWTTD